MTSPLLTLIEQNQWEDFQPLMDRLRRWQGWSLFLEKLNTLNRDVLFDSKVHGCGHIERTMLHGAFCAMEDGLDMEDTALLLECCAYHDVGRVSDNVDYLHGHRSAQRLGALTGREGEALKMMMAAVDAHSRLDSELEDTLSGYHPADWQRCLRLAQLLKDADGLDRVRIFDLDVRFLRREASREREGFAEYLFGRYQRLTHAPISPPFPRELTEKLWAKQTERNRIRNRSSRYDG
jgi:hypothetical protein